MAHENSISWSVEDLFLASFNTRISHLDIDEISKLSSIAEQGELAEDYGILDNSPTITLIDADQQIRIKVGTAHPRGKLRIHSI